MARIKLPPVPVHKNVHVYAYLSKKLDKQLRSAAKQNHVPISWAVAVAWTQFCAATRRVRAERYSETAGPASRVRAHFYLPIEVADQMRVSAARAWLDNQIRAEARLKPISIGRAIEAAWAHYVDSQRG